MAKLLSSLSNGARVKFGKHSVGAETAQSIVWLVADKNHSGYPANSVTLITQEIIDLRAYDGKESTETTGNPNYGLSNINQWLNSSASAGKWYSAAHDKDTPPSKENVLYSTDYDLRSGFLYNFTFAERECLLPTTIQFQVGSVVSSTTQKVFLPSLREIAGSSTTGESSSQLSYFSSISIKCVVSSQAYTNTSSTSKPSSQSSYWDYVTRSTSATGKVYTITSTGAGGSTDAYSGQIGIRPIINLSANTIVSDTTDGNGYYTIISNNAPTISGSDANLGIKTDAFSQTYVVGDADNHVTTVKEYIDNVEIRSYVATLGQTNTFAITGKTWLKLANGNHTMKIVANDGSDAVTRTYTFTKSVSTLVVQKTTPISSNTRPKSIIVTVVKNIPTEAIFKVEACNNGFDNTPVWEDITSKVTRGEIYDFTNTAKTAGQWGVNIRVTVDRNGSEGACYITEIGGNFE